MTFRTQRLINVSAGVLLSISCHVIAGGNEGTIPETSVNAAKSPTFEPSPKKDIKLVRPNARPDKSEISPGEFHKLLQSAAQKKADHSK